EAAGVGQDLDRRAGAGGDGGGPGRGGRGCALTHHDAAQAVRIAPLQARAGGQGLDAARVQHGGGPAALGDDHRGGRSGVVEQLAERDAAVVVHGIGGQADRGGQGRGGGDQGEDQGGHGGAERR